MNDEKMFEQDFENFVNEQASKREPTEDEMNFMRRQNISFETKNTRFTCEDCAHDNYCRIEIDGPDCDFKAKEEP